jgi:hypothetical protein
VSTGFRLTLLEQITLRSLSRGMNIDQIARLTGVAGPIIAAKVGNFFVQGYINEQYFLTERGFEALGLAIP